MCCPEDPFFTPLLQFARVPFQAKKSVHKTLFWENLEILASTVSIFTQNLAHKPPNLEIFSSEAPKFGNSPFTSPQIWEFSVHEPPFQRQVSVRKPHTSEIRAAHPYLKKVECPPPPVLHAYQHLVLLVLTNADILLQIENRLRNLKYAVNANQIHTQSGINNLLPIWIEGMEYSVCLLGS